MGENIYIKLPAYKSSGNIEEFNLQNGFTWTNAIENTKSKNDGKKKRNAFLSSCRNKMLAIF